MSRTNSLSLNHLFRSQHPVHRTELCQIRQGQRLSTVSFLPQKREERRRKKSTQIGRNHFQWEKAFSLSVTLSRTFLMISRNSSQNFPRNSDSLRRRHPTLLYQPLELISHNGPFDPFSSCEEHLELSCHRRSEGYLVTGLLQSSLSGQDIPATRASIDVYHHFLVHV